MIHPHHCTSENEMVEHDVHLLSHCLSNVHIVRHKVQKKAHVVRGSADYAELT